MEWENHTILVEFFLKGLSGHPRLDILDPHLHTPMYFFLGNLSFLHICYTTTSIPSTLVSFLSERKTISLSGCAVQMFLGLAMGTTECVLLGMMAFDHYVAICNHLRYPIIMSKDAYVSMEAGSWIIGPVNSAVQTVFVVQLPFCRNNTINHFTCEILAVIKLACAGISGNEFIIIFEISSSDGRSKAFSTCSAHLSVVITFCGTIFLMYMKPKSKETLNSDDLDATDKLIFIFYRVMTPTMNPLIYSLRNKDVKETVKHILRRKVFNK
uniref:G-protein coupled receptors family 1 profile domain-containing protein n=1 Tax=Nomascus leucogenys TaxID=61853 RepID=A0A2I3GBE5_NOMLE